MIVDFDNLLNQFSALLANALFAQKMDFYLHKLKRSLAYGPDDIFPIALKCSSPDPPPYLVHTFNLSMVYGRIPVNLNSFIISLSSNADPLNPLTITDNH